MTDVIQFPRWRTWRRKFMDEGEFSRKGYLGEANRRFFHPLGLSLTLWEDQGELRLKVLDRREFPYGIVTRIKDDDEYVEACRRAAERIDHEWEAHAAARRETYGFVVQPVDSYDDTEP